jgi:hypothetical protein
MAQINYRVPTEEIPRGMVRDYNIAQGVTHPSDLTTRIVRDINMRYVTVENSSQHTPMGIGIAESFERFPQPPIKFSVGPGEIRHIGINSIGEQIQWLHMLDLQTGYHVGDPYAFRTDANQFVLREGINKWFVSPFHRATYRAS